MSWFVLILSGLAISAMLFGQDYRHRTVQSLLALPISRGTALAARFAALAVILGTLLLTAWLLPEDLVYGPRGDLMVLAGLATSACIVPVFTMLGRSELAGLVLGAAVPAVLWIGGQLAAVVVYGSATPSRATSAAIEAYRLALFVPGFVAACVVGLVATIYCFIRLEAAELPRDVVLFARRARTSAVSAGRSSLTRRNRYWCLIAKEIRLYRLPGVVAILFGLAWVAVAWSARSLEVMVDLDTVQRGISAFYMGVTVFLVGAITSAEERQLGTLPLQLLVPVSGRSQWLVKVACGLAVLLVLAVLVPSALLWMLPGPAGTFQVRRFARDLFLGNFQGTAMLTLLFAVSVYVSSLSTGTIRALLTAIGATIAASTFVGQFALAPLNRFLRWIYQHADPNLLAWVPDPAAWFPFTSRWLPLALGGGVVFVALRYAERNHLSLDAARRRVVLQTARLTLVVFLAVAIQYLVVGWISTAWVLRAEQHMRRAQPTVTATPTPAAPR